MRFSWTFSEFVRFSWKFSELFGKSTNSTLGKRVSFSQNSQKWHPLSENVRFSWKLSEFLGKSTNSTLGKRVSFSQNSQKMTPFFLKLCVFRWNLVNYLENLQILPLGNVRHFRRIRKNDVPFLKTCVFFAEFTEISIFRRTSVISVNKVTIFKQKKHGFPVI